MKFLIVASGYNCEKYVKPCLDSVIAQTYKNFECLVIDDCSTDNTFKEISKYNFHTYKTQKNVGTALARDYAIKSFKGDYDVIVWLDLDDELKPDALEHLNLIYTDEVWLTYGNFETDGKPFFNEKNIYMSDNFRDGDFKFGHLRSFRKHLYFQLKDNEINPEDVECYKDALMLYRLLELAGHSHIQPVLKVLYKYNKPQNRVINRFNSEYRTKELNYIKNL